MDDIRILTQVEAARLLGVSARTVRRLVQRGVLRPVRLGPGMRPRIRYADLLQLLEQAGEERGEGEEP